MNRIILIIVILLSVCTRSYSSDSLQIDKSTYLNTLSNALKKIGENMPYSAIDIMESLKETSKLDNSGYNVLMLAYNSANKDNEVISLYKEWESNKSLVNEASLREKMSMYSNVSLALSHIGRYEESILMTEKYIDGLKELDEKTSLVYAYALISETYQNLGDSEKALKFLNDAINLKLELFNANIIDVLNERIHDTDLSEMYVSAANWSRKKGDLKETERYLALSCACGNNSAIEFMNKSGLKYKKILKSLKKGVKIGNQGFYETSY